MTENKQTDFEKMSEEEEVSCAEQYEHGCQDCEDYGCPYRDAMWTDPQDEPGCFGDYAYGSETCDFCEECENCRRRGVSK